MKTTGQVIETINYLTIFTKSSPNVISDIYYDKKLKKYTIASG